MSYSDDQARRRSASQWCVFCVVVVLGFLANVSCSLPGSDWRSKPPLLNRADLMHVDDKTSLGFEPHLDDDAMSRLQQAADDYDLAILVPSRTLGPSMPEPVEHYELELLEWDGTEERMESMRIAYRGRDIVRHENGRTFVYDDLWEWWRNDSLGPSRKDLSGDCRAAEPLEIRGGEGCRILREFRGPPGRADYWTYEWLEDGQRHHLRLSPASAEAFALDEVLAWLDSLVEVRPSA